MIGSSDIVRKFGNLGGYAFARFLTRSHPRILMYHRFSQTASGDTVSAADFEQQVRYIARHFNPITVTDLATQLYEKGAVPKNAIAITVDDGYRDFYDVAFPILQKYSVPATFYVTTGFIDQCLWLWPDQLRYILTSAPESHKTYQFKHFEMTTPLAPGDVDIEFGQLVTLFLSLSNEDKLQSLRDMADAWDVHVPSKGPDGYEPATWNQLREMQSAGIEIGGHTVTHPSLSRIAFGEAESEIMGSAQDLEKNLGKRTRSFCYPNGTADDFVGKQVALVQKAGFSCAVVAFADAQEHQQRYAMRRHSSSADEFQFLKAASGIELLGHKWRKNVVETPYGQG